MNEIGVKGGVAAATKNSTCSSMMVTINKSTNPYKAVQSQIPSTVYFDHCLVCNRICYLPEKVSPSEALRVAETRQLFYTLYNIPVSSQTVASLKDELPLCPECLLKFGRLRQLRDILTQIQANFDSLKEGIAFEIVDLVARSEKGVASAGMDYGWRDVPQESVRQCLVTAEVDTLQQIIFDDWHERHPTTETESVVCKPKTVNNSITIKKSSHTPSIVMDQNKAGADPIFRTPLPPPPKRTFHKQSDYNYNKIPPLRSFPLISISPSPPRQNLSKKLMNTNIFLNKLSPIPNLNKVGFNGKSGSITSTSTNAAGHCSRVTKQSQPLSQSKTTVISITTSDETRKNSGNGTLHSNNSSSTSTTNLFSLKRKLSLEGEQNKTPTPKSIEIVVGDEKSLAPKRQKSEHDMVISMSSSSKDFKHDENKTAEDVSSDGISVTKVEATKTISSQNGDGSQHEEPEEELFDDDETEPDYGDIGLGDYLEGGGGQLEELDDEGDGENGSRIGIGLNLNGSDDDDAEVVDICEPKKVVDPSYVESLIAHLQSGDAAGNVEFLQNQEGLYVCMYCSKTFIHKYPYRDHLKTHTGEGPRCPICSKIFPKNHNLMLHLRTHTGEKPFTCDVCNKGFADKSNLKVHYRVHTGEKPYKCEYCDQAFVNSSRLVVHRRLHTGEKPFHCDTCAKSFSTANQLIVHKKVHDEGQDVQDLGILNDGDGSDTY